MHVLITQSHFGVGGTETYAVTVGVELERLGHRVTLHAPAASDLGRELAAGRGLELSVGEVIPAGADVAITQDGASANLLAARDPAPRQVFVMHGVSPIEHPPRGLAPATKVVVFNERLRRHVEASEESPPVLRMRQPLDILRFRPRSAAPTKARRLLLLSNRLGPGRTRMLEEACDDLGLELIRVGAPTTPSIDPREALAGADIVVGYGRSILEGMAMGRPAYVWERAGGDGWVTPENYAALEADGFSGAATDTVIDGERLRSDLAGYRSEWGDLGYELIRLHHSAARHAEALIRELGEGAAPTRQDSAETIALLVRAEKRAIAQAEGAETAQASTATYARELEVELTRVHAAVAEMNKGREDERAGWERDRRTWETERSGQATVNARLRAELADVLGSRTWRLAEPVRRLVAWLRALRP